jgi:hypothetical protein
MSIEQIARNVVVNMVNVDKVKSMLTADAMASGGVLPQPIPAMEALKVTAGLTTAFPDIQFDIQRVSVDGDRATVDVIWRGTNTGSLSLPIPGMSTIPATGKKVSVKDSYILTVKGDKVSHFQIKSPADGGIPAAIEQLGVKVPSM